jgi:hypothetical protein
LSSGVVAGVVSTSVIRCGLNRTGFPGGSNS